MLKKAKKRFLHLGPSEKIIIIFAFFIILFIFLPTSKTSFEVESILFATSIFYSILLGFYISAAMSNLNRLKELVATETGGLIAIYHLAKICMPQRIMEVKKSIDRYLIRRFDYEIHNYAKPTTKEFYAIFDVLKKANAKSKGEEAAITYLAEGLYYIAQSRRELTIVGARIINKLSWIVLMVLSSVIVALLFFMRDGTIESAFFTALLSSSAILSLLILNDVDGNKFGEEHFAIETYQSVFEAMGEKHYYSKHYLINGRFKPSVKEYRTEETKGIKELKESISIIECSE